MIGLALAALLLLTSGLAAAAPVARTIPFEAAGRIWVNGLVSKPGTCPVTQNTTLGDVLLRVGGIMSTAGSVKVEVIRNERVPLSASWTELLRHPAGLKVPVRPGDRVRVIRSDEDARPPRVIARAP